MSPLALAAGDKAAIPEATWRAVAERLRFAAEIGDIGGGHGTGLNRFIAGDRQVGGTKRGEARVRVGDVHAAPLGAGEPHLQHHS